MRAAAWLAVYAPLPYSVSRLVWAAGIPLGIDAWLLREFHSPGWGSLYILALALLPEAVAAFTQVFVRGRARALAPGIVVSVLLVPILVLAGFNIWSLGVMADGFSIPAENAGVDAWAFWGQVVTFWVWGVALMLATYGYWSRTRYEDQPLPAIDSMNRTDSSTDGRARIAAATRPASLR